MLKIDLHIHTKEDPTETISYSAKQLIDKASELKFDAIAITNHGSVAHTKEIYEYSKNKNILLIPGAEILVNDKEVLVYNITEEDRKKIKSFEDLKKLKNSLVIAPHPFFTFSQCLKGELIKNIECFDGIEYSHFYIKNINNNNKAVEVAKKYDVALVGNSDSHSLWQLGTTYSLIDAKKNIQSVFNAIKKNNVIVKTKPLKIQQFIYIGSRATFHLIKKKIFAKWKKLKQQS